MANNGKISWTEAQEEGILPPKHLWCRHVSGEDRLPMAYAAEGLPATQHSVSVDVQHLYPPKIRLSSADMEHNM